MSALKLNKGSTSHSAYDLRTTFSDIVEKHENCLHILPSGKSHNEIPMREAETHGVIDAKGSVLV